MKKLFAATLSLALLCAASVSALAATETIDKTKGSTANVTGTYVAGTATQTIYSVDISWGSMAFTYTDASEGTWDPTTHKYDNATAAAWSCADGANKVTVRNHSNAVVTATLSYASETGFDKITGKFDNSTLTLDSAVGKALTDTPTATATLTLTGELPSTTGASATIGTVTVSLTD